MCGPQTWKKIKAGYLAGKTPQELSREFQVAAKTISNRASVEKWREGREQVGNIVAEELPRARADRIIDQAAEIAAAQVTDLQDLWGKIKGQAEAILTEQTREVPTKVGPMEIKLGANDRLAGLRQAAQALKDAQVCIRKALGLDDDRGPDPGQEGGVIELPAIVPPPDPPPVEADG